MLKKYKIKKILKNQRGQTIIEFILLLGVMMGISLMFYSNFNKQMGKMWIKLVRVVVDDKSQDFDFE